MDTDEYKKKCEWLASFYKEAAETGRPMQVLCEDWLDYDQGPNMQSRPDEWRLKPEPQKAWVVWLACNNGKYETASFPSREEAERFSSQRNATIQEITRPEPQ